MTRSLNALKYLSLLLFVSAASADCLVPQWETNYYLAFPGQTRDTLAAADFNADGKVDVVVIGGTSAVTDAVVVMRGNGDGTFGAPVTVHQADQLYQVLARDLNGDAKIDLLIEDGGFALVFLPGHGDGTFGTPVVSPTPEGYRLAVAELTGDGIVDVASFFYDETGPDGVIILAGNGEGAFVETRRQLLAAGGMGIAVGDLDADGATDIVVSYYQSQTIDLLFGNGDSTFDPAVSKQSGMYATSLTIGDAEGDGDLDILAPNWYDDTLSLHRNLGGRMFDPAAVYPIHIESDFEENNLNSVAVADVTGDGHLDLIVASVNAGYIATLAGNGDGTFGLPSFELIHGGLERIGPVAAADLNGDGRVDVITNSRIHGSVFVLRNHCGDIGEIRLTPQIPTILIGQSATFQVKVIGYDDFNMAPLPTGDVAIMEGDIVLATAALSSGDASLTIEGLALGEHALVVHYAGDAQYEAAESSPVLQRVTSEATTTVVETQPSESIYGQDVTLTATVTSSDGTTPGGTIEYGIGTISSQGPAPSHITNTSNLPVGTHIAFARYQGDATHPPSEAAPITHVVGKATSIVEWIQLITLNPEGTDVNVYVHVNPQYSSDPTGTIQLFDRNVLISTKQMTEPPHYILGVSGLAPGRHDFRASYSGDDNFHGSESTILTHDAFASSGLLIDARGRADGIVLAWPYMNDTTRQVGRAIAPDPAFTGRVSIGRTTLDQETSPGVVYLYRLEFWSGGLISGFGPVDLGVRMTFSEDPLLPGMKVRASHFQEVIDATNFLRGKVGQSLVVINDLAAGTSIRASHITTLRTKINEARIALGAAPVSFIRAIAPGDIIRAQDLQELREAVH